MKYKLSESGVTLTQDDGSVLSIPAAEGNRHWQAYQEWMAEGNTPEPEFTADELQAKEDAEKVAGAEMQLKETDWVVVKMAEAQLLGQDVETLKAKYASTLAIRDLARETINLYGK